MRDAYALLGFPRRPQLDVEAITRRYRELSAAAHPDRLGGTTERAADLNLARVTLAEIGPRLRHLAALRGDTGSTGSGIAGDWEISSRIGAFQRDVNAWSARHNTLTTALERGLSAVRQVELSEVSDALRQQLDSAERDIARTVLELDQRWPDVTNEELLAAADSWTFWKKCDTLWRDAAACLAGA